MKESDFYLRRAMEIARFLQTSGHGLDSLAT